MNLPPRTTYLQPFAVGDLVAARPRTTSRMLHGCIAEIDRFALTLRVGADLVVVDAEDCVLVLREPA